MLGRMTDRTLQGAHFAAAAVASAGLHQAASTSATTEAEEVSQVLGNGKNLH